MTLRELRDRLNQINEAWLDGPAVTEMVESHYNHQKIEGGVKDVLDDGTLVLEEV